MNLIELRSKSEKELNETLSQLKRNLQSMKFELAAGKIKNVRLIHQTKKDIARILTILKEKQH
jgi:large subunit ribosomal protein L29